MQLRIKHIIITCLCAATSVLTASAQNQTTTQGENQEVLLPGETPKPSKYIAVEEQEQKLVFFQGFTLSVDGFGLVQKLASDYGALEAALRLNLKNTYLPIFELGYAQCEKQDINTGISFNVKAPYARIGVDYNLLKDKFQDNRLYAGVRYGFSTYQYDIAGPAMVDPVWGGSEAFDLRGINCTSHWGEVVFGVEAKIFKNLHMGWLVRYKKEFASSKSDYAKPSCIPGYGYTTTESCWGGTYSVIFDLNWGKKKSHKKGIKVEIRDIENNGTEQGTNNDGQGTNNDNGEGEEQL